MTSFAPGPPGRFLHGHTQKAPPAKRRRSLRFYWFFYLISRGVPDCAHAGRLLQELCHRAGHDAAQNAGDEELHHALHADQQHHEHEGVRSTLDGHEVLHVVTAVEGQHDQPMKNTVFRNGALMALTM